MILGRTIYQQIITELSPDDLVYEGMHTYVFTNQVKADKQNISFISSEISEFIDDLKMKPGKNIWICG